MHYKNSLRRSKLLLEHITLDDKIDKLKRILLHSSKREQPQVRRDLFKLMRRQRALKTPNKNSYLNVGDMRVYPQWGENDLSRKYTPELLTRNPDGAYHFIYIPKSDYLSVIESEEPMETLLSEMIRDREITKKDFLPDDLGVFQKAQIFDGNKVNGNLVDLFMDPGDFDVKDSDLQWQRSILYGSLGKIDDPIFDVEEDDDLRGISLWNTNVELEDLKELQDHVSEELDTRTSEHRIVFIPQKDL